MATKEEIEYLAEDRDRYKELFHQAVRNRDEFVALADVKQKQLEIASKNYSILYNEKVELQKQVDELKAALADTIKRNEELIEENEQIVKDTAKEIFAELFYIASIHHSDVANILAWAKEKAKSKGVKVE